jgi:anti-sigma B factor antagonist
MDRLARMELESVERVVVARIDGDIDASNAQELGDALVESLTNDTLGVVLDLTPLNYMDSAGVHLILGLENRLRQRRQEVRTVVPADAPLRAVLDLTAVDKSVPVHADRDEAVEAIRRRERP